MDAAVVSTASPYIRCSRCGRTVNVKLQHHGIDGWVTRMGNAGKVEIVCTVCNQPEERRSLPRRILDDLIHRMLGD